MSWEEFNAKQKQTGPQAYTTRTVKTKQVKRYKGGQLEKVYQCPQDVREDGYNPSAVHEVCKGNRRTHGGCVWVYGDNVELKRYFTPN